MPNLPRSTPGGGPEAERGQEELLDRVGDGEIIAKKAIDIFERLNHCGESGGDDFVAPSRLISGKAAGGFLDPDHQLIAD